MAYNFTGDSTSVGTHLEPFADGWYPLLKDRKYVSAELSGIRAGSYKYWGNDLICEFYLSMKLKHIFFLATQLG